jgi:hypothetical protein
MRFEPIIQMPCMVTGMWRRFGVHLFEGKVTLDHMAAMEANGNAWHKKNPGKLVEMVVVYPSDARMTHDERVRMAGIIKRWEGHRTASATVILASGLVGAMHRSVLTGMQMLVPSPHPTKVFGATRDAVTWIAPHVQALCGPEATRDELLAAVEALAADFRSARTSAASTPAR